MKLLNLGLFCFQLIWFFMHSTLEGVPVNPQYRFLNNVNVPSNKANEMTFLEFQKTHNSRLTDLQNERDKIKNSVYQTQLPLYMENNYKPIDLTLGSAATFNTNSDYFHAMENQMAPLENDYADVLTNFKKIGCFQNDSNPLGISDLIIDPINGVHNVSKQAQNSYSLCDGDLADMLFLPLGAANTHVSQIYNHLNNAIYRPLSYKMSPNRFSYSDALHDMLFLDKDNLMIQKNLPIPDFSKFQNMILGGFAQIANYASDFDANKPIISKIVLDILKHFHIYWNVKRQQKQVDSTKVNTYSILKKIIQRYREQNDAMKATTVQILLAIKDGYFKFMRAHKLHALIRSKASEMLCYQFLKRYDNFVQEIRDGKFRNEPYFYELSVFMELLRTIATVNLKNGMKDNQNTQFITNMIVDKIKDMYNVYLKYMQENNDPMLDLVTEFTATLLLKIEHRRILMINIHSVQGFLQKEPFTLRSIFTTYIKLFYEIMDWWMVVPTKCQDYSRLQICASGYGLKTLNKLRYKYSLHNSVAGANLYRFLRDSYRQLITSIAEKDGFSNPETFRNMYFAELFRVSEMIRVSYKINDMSAVDSLQNQIGELIEKEKTRPKILSASLEMLTKLDDGLYDFFLTIKNDYNAFAPVDKNGVSMNQINKKFCDFLEKFSNENPASLNPFTEGLFDIFKHVASTWATTRLAEYSTSIEPDVALTPGTTYVPLPVKGSVAVENIVKEPQIDSGSKTPIFMGRNQY